MEASTAAVEEYNGAMQRVEGGAVLKSSGEEESEAQESASPSTPHTEVL